MKILKVEVDELPESCPICPLSILDRFDGKQYIICPPTNKFSHQELLGNRLNNCPLTVAPQPQSSGHVQDEKGKVKND